MNTRLGYAKKRLERHIKLRELRIQRRDKAARHWAKVIARSDGNIKKIKDWIGRIENLIKINGGDVNV